MKLLKYIAVLALCFAVPTQADELRQCSVTFTNSVAGTTSAPTTGTCSWIAGATVAMQCDQAVYYNADKSATTGGATTATSVDFSVDFTANSDPYIIVLAGNAKHISILGVSTSGTCKFGPMRAKKL